MPSLLVRADAVVSASGLLGDALEIAGGRVVRTGNHRDLARPGLPEVAYPGTTIVPGLGDAHFHPLGYTASLTRLTVYDATSIDDVIDAVRATAASLPPGASVVATRLDEHRLVEGRLPTRADLDVIDRPVLLYRVCGHVAVANTEALAASGVGSGTPDPPGGILDRDERGHPTGVLRETAIPLVSEVVGTRTRDLTPNEVTGALTGLHHLGLTRVGAMATWGHGLLAGGPSELGTLLQAAPELPIGVDVFLIAGSAYDLDTAARAIQAANAPRLRFAGVKIFADGSFGGHTAAMRQPFADVPTTGTLRLDDRAPALARRSLDLGGRVAVHAIGDLAVHKVLDLFTTLVDEGCDPSRLRLEHASVMLEDDRTRMADLGVIASMQPAFVTSEASWLESLLGPERLPFTYAHRSILEAGIPVAGGSDCPVEQPSPLWGMYSAMNRMGVSPQEELSAAQALGIFTDGVAASLGEPHPLSPGSPAHLTILDENPLTVDRAAIPTLGVRSVWVAGEPFDQAAATGRAGA